MTSEIAVAASRTSGGVPTPGASDRRDLGLAQRTTRAHERIDPANPSGRVDAPIAARVAAFPDATDLPHAPTGRPIDPRLPGPWRLVLS